MDDPDQPLTLEDALNKATPRLFVTPALVVLLFGTFAAATLLSHVSPLTPSSADLAAVGGDVFALTVGAGQWWRLFTATLIHAGVLHLLVNVWSLWNVGRLAERLFGNGGYLALYVLAGIGGSVASLHYNQFNVSVGASGSIFGLIGGLLAFVLRERRTLPPPFVRSIRNSTLSVIGLNLLIGFSMPFVDNAAHVGGLVTGFVSGWLLARDLRQPKAGLMQRRLGGLGVVVLLVLGAAGLTWRLGAVEVSKDMSTAQLLAAAQARSKRGDSVGAVVAFTQVLTQDAQSREALLGRGQAHFTLGHMRAARDDFEAAMQGAPADIKAALAPLLCETAYSTGDDLGAIDACDRVDSREALGVRAEAMLTKARALTRSGEYLEAHQAIDRALNWLGADSGPVLAVRAETRFKQGFPDDAKALCRKAPVAGDAMSLRLCAGLLATLNDAEGGKLLFERAGSLASKSALATEYAVFLVQVGQYAAAMVVLDEATKSSTAESLNNRAWVRVIAEDGAAALKDADAALALEPDNAYALGTRCWAYALLGDDAKALADCRRAVELKPGTDEDEAMLAQLEGRHERAAFLWRVALASSPANAFMKSWLERALNGAPDAATPTESP